MENEKYGVEFVSKTEQFKKGLQDLANFVRKFGKEVKEETSIQINPNISKKELLTWREDLKKSIEESKLNVKGFKNTSSEDYYKEQLNQYQKGLNLVNTRIEEIENNEKEYNDELKETKELQEEVENVSNKTSLSIKNMLDGGISKIKRFTYYLLGARSVFSLFMKYQSIYYQYNEKMQYQSELSQNAIALSLAPAFEFLGNMVTYASIGFAKFIELLTGVNVLSKVTTKGIRDYNKSLKETQTLVGGIDEITNLTNPGNLGLASQYQALADFQEKVREVTKWFEENPWIKDLASALKTAWDWILKIIDGVGGVQNALLLLGGYKVMTSIGKLIGTAGIAGVGASGLLGVVGVLGLVAEGLHQISKANTSKPFEENMRNLSMYAEKFNKNMSATEYRTNLIAIDTELVSIATKIKEQPEEYKNVQNELDKIWDKLKSITGIDYKAKIDAQLEYDPKQEEGLFNGLKSGFNTMINGFKDALNGDEMTKSWETFRKNAEKELNKIALKQQYFNLAVKFNIDKNSVLTLANRVKNLSSIFGISNSTFDNIASKVLKNFGYAKGLDYVPYDNYPALLHKGEAVVPAKYNPTIHSEGNEYTNSLLETVVMKLDDLSRRPNEFIIDGQKFANATYNLYESEKNRQNYVEGVVVR